MPTGDLIKICDRASHFSCKQLSVFRRNRSKVSFHVHFWTLSKCESKSKYFHILMIYHFAKSLENTYMGKIDDNRRKNARLLAAEIGGNSRFARKVELSDSRVTQLIGENYTRNIGDKTAAIIEQAFGKDSGWLDTIIETDPTNSSLTSKSSSTESANLVQSTFSNAIKTESCQLHYVTLEELQIILTFRAADSVGKASINSATAAVQKSNNLLIQPKVAV